ncbi:protein MICRORCHIDIA 6-like isoform X2 [Rutidosis leptorrhynchoides]
MTDFCWDYGPREVDTGLIKLEAYPRTIVLNECLRDEPIHNICNVDGITQESEVNWSSNGSSTGQSGTCVVEQETSLVDNPSPCMTSSTCVAPVCRQFWKAGDYIEDSTPTINQAGSRINIHPRFLHSNATSHKWAFGAIAELLDNAVDEIQKGATHVLIDKTLNPRNGSPALLIQDDGAGMDPEALRRCLSFGFSDRKSETAIGKYGNGFKTSSIRLGSDVIVFTRNIVDTTITQSIGLLSYTFLRQSGYDRIVVPMVHYVWNWMTSRFDSIQPKSVERSDSNLQMLLKWSPFSTEEELLKQFDDVGHQGTKIIVYNLWLDDEGKMELDFDSDPKDIRIGLDAKVNAKAGSLKAINENHVAKRLWFSLRAYLSILYRNLPETFGIYLRRKIVIYHNIATALKFVEFIQYKAHNKEGIFNTTIGFLKEAPNVSIHGFNIYHKNRLILPFLPVVNFGNGKGRGVVGVLEADNIAPTHNKQDFEDTNVYQKLITRLRDMTYEYWDKHSPINGDLPVKKTRRQSASPNSSMPSKIDAVGSSKNAPIITNISTRTAFNESNLKRKDHPVDSSLENARVAPCVADTGSNVADDAHDQKKINLLIKQKCLQEKCFEFEKSEKEYNLKVTQLMRELEVAQNEYAALLTNLQLLEKLEGNTTNAVWSL